MGIWKGFGEPNKHLGFWGSQIIVGRQPEDQKTNYSFAGLHWHTEAGNIWFVQVHGTKHWHFLAPRDSNLMAPMIESKNSLAVYNGTYAETLYHRLPIRDVMVRAGDILYVPDFEWHHTRHQ